MATNERGPPRKSYSANFSRIARADKEKAPQLSSMHTDDAKSDNAKAGGRGCSSLSVVEILGTVVSSAY